MSTYHSSQVFFCLFSLSESRGWGCKLALYCHQPSGWHNLESWHWGSLATSLHLTSLLAAPQKANEYMAMGTMVKYSEVWQPLLHSVFYPPSENTSQQINIHVFLNLSYCCGKKKSAKKQLRFINENVFHLYTCYTGHANTEIYRLYNDTIIKYSMTFVKHSVLQQNKLFLLVYYLGNRWRTNLEDTVPCYSLLHSQKKVFLWSTLT